MQSFLTFLTGLGAALTLPVGCIGSSGTPTIEGNYLVCGITVTPGGIAGYATGIDDLGTEQNVDLGKALPLPPGGTCVAHDGAIFVTDMESPVIIRYELDADRVLVEAGRVNFGGEGVTAISPSPNRVKILNDDKAYLVDSDTGQVIVWNPSTMEIAGNIELEGFESDIATKTMFVTAVVLRGDQLLLVATYGIPDLNLPEMRLGVIDTNTDTFEVTSTTDRCGGLGHFGYTLLGDGAIYLTSNSFAAGSYRIGSPGSFPPCMMRIQAGSDVFDEDYFVEFGDLTGFSEGAEIFPGPGNSAFTLVFDEEVAPLPDNPGVRDVSNANGWRLVRIHDITAAEPETSIVEGTEPTSGFVPSYFINGRTYFGQLGALFSSTTLYDVTDDGPAVEAATLPGFASLILPLE